MSEQLRHNHEAESSHESERPYGEIRRTETVSIVENASEAERADRLEHLAKKVEQAQAKSEKRIEPENHDPKPTQAHHTGSSVYTASQTVKRAQKQLRGAERGFSKVIHNPKVEAVSDVAGGTIARPSGLLIGGLFSLVATIAVIVICRYYGYEYNYLIGLACFGLGFIVGLLVEALYKLGRKATGN